MSAVILPTVQRSSQTRVPKAHIPPKSVFLASPTRGQACDRARQNVVPTVEGQLLFRRGGTTSPTLCLLSTPTPTSPYSFLYVTLFCPAREELNLAVLHAFVDLHEFTDLNLVQALRQFLWSFRLPGEAQKIDRMMEAFAQRYCLCNPGVFQSTDTCYVLSFAVIMLNTSLHNPNVRDKPGLERFVAMNRGINEGGDLPEELLRNLYDSIRNEPFKIPEDDGNDLTHTFFNPDREGWLLKLGGGRVKTWKRRWFILTDNCLYYFEYTTDKEPRGIIPLENLSIREVDDPRKPNCFELYIPNNKGQLIKACKTEADGRVVEGNHMVYRISAPTQEEKDEWIKSIQAAVSVDPFYEMLAARKKRISIKKKQEQP
ncbi:PREDICTED: cytohesin-2 isoform X2 [Galeopterus variegatus]|uniref:Cytohesin-2 n=1 Tax=Galeopterus variegatus TaxID=482537 RepID=A0ABM0QGK5_GALVR|nr:PREDICTED: cytohesin-2 isoform X2 [Galeopterus variegatus]